MKKLIVSLLITLVFLGGCQEVNNTPKKSIFIKDDQGNDIVTVTDLASASLTENKYNGNELIIGVIFKDASKVKEMTEAQLNKNIHIYLDEKLLASPFVSSVIEYNSIMITGDFSKKDAEAFISIINN